MQKVMKLKRQKNEKFYKAVGFYFCICSGLVAILVIAAVQFSLSKGSTQNQLADLNEPVATEQANTTDEETKNTTNTKDAKTDTAKNETNNDETNLLENDIVDDLSLNEEGVNGTANTEEAPKSQTADDSQTTPANSSADTDLDAVSVSAKNNSFNQEKGLLWPINGDILMNFSADKVVYFSTLGQYKCNPAILIKGDVGQEVLCSYKGTITDVTENEETGLTVTMDIGSGYQIIYGQLKDLSVKKGDAILEGETIGYLKKPTKYYTEEGSHLYFQVKENDESVDPLLLLR